MTYRELHLPEHLGHTVTFFTYGNPQGIPILCFHGGPGSKSRPEHAERFDLSKYYVILFDQRGCGKSSPSGNTENNNTDNTLYDAERIRKALSINQWFISGSSFGSTCSLLYAIKHPDRVRGLLLSSIFLADKESIEYATASDKGAARFVPEAWTSRMNFFKEFNINLETQSEDLTKAFENASLDKQKQLAAGILNWEGSLLSPYMGISSIQAKEIKESDLSFAKISLHYAKNKYFISEGYILENIEKIKKIPTIIIHGRYDILCPVDKAFTLKEHLADATVIVANSSGHRLSQEGEMIRFLSFSQFLERLN